MSPVALSGSLGLAPGQGEVILVVAGTVLVFAGARQGRRLPLTTLVAGELAVGCEPDAHGRRLFLSGLPGTTVRTTSVQDVLVDGGRGDLEHWITAVSDSARGGRWIDHVVAPDRDALRLAPGEHVAATSRATAAADRQVLGWLHVVAGEARFCDWSQAAVGPTDGAVPMTRGAWLTSGLHSRIAKAPGPSQSDGAGWTASDLMDPRLGLAAAGQRRAVADARRIDRLAGVDATGQEDVSAGVVALSGAFSASTRAAAAPPADLATPWWTAQEVGLATDDSTLLRAQRLRAQGVAPIRAVAEACGARLARSD